MTNSDSDVSIESDGITLAGIWVSLEPGYRVFYKGYPAQLVIERDGKIISQ